MAYAAATMATFPSFVASGRDNNVDALLILFMSLACLTGLLAAERGSWRWLAATAVLVGLAFNTKTLAAYLVVPGLALAWLVCAPRPTAARVKLLVAAGVVLAVLSLAWMVVVEATPPSDRPFVGSTTDNSEFSLFFLHNGFGQSSASATRPRRTSSSRPRRAACATAAAPRQPARQARCACSKSQTAASARGCFRSPPSGCWVSRSRSGGESAAIPGWRCCS